MDERETGGKEYEEKTKTTLDRYADGGGHAVRHNRERRAGTDSGDGKPWHRTGITDAAQETETDSWNRSLLPERVKAWAGEYETATTQEEADALRTQDESKNLLIAAKECALSGLELW